MAGELLKCLSVTEFVYMISFSHTFKNYIIIKISSQKGLEDC